MTERNQLIDITKHLRDGQSHIMSEAADAIELLQRKLNCSEELWEQQQELALEYLADIEKAKDWIAEQDKEIHELKIELAKWVNYWRDKDNKALQARIAELEEQKALLDEHLSQACDNIKKRNDRIEELEAALKPFAQKRLSTELTGVTSEYMSPLLAHMKEIKKMEESDNNISAARKALEKDK